MMYAVTASTDRELEQILALQQLNLRGVQPAAVEKEQGFVTVAHTFIQLRQLNDCAPAILVKDGDHLAGYALVMTPESAGTVPELAELFNGLSRVMYRGEPLKHRRWYVMGQVCVAERFRGRHVFSLLYAMHRHCYSPRYDLLITEISERNTRSLRAHEKIGFRPVDAHRMAGEKWVVVAWDWSQ